MHGYDHAFPIVEQGQEELCANEIGVCLGCVLACVGTVDAWEFMGCCWAGTLLQFFKKGGVMGGRMPCSWDEEYGWLGSGHCGFYHSWNRHRSKMYGYRTERASREMI